MPKLAGASLGAGLAALVIASGAWPPSSRATPLQLRPLSLRDNKQQLSSAETTTLLRWARRYRACAVRHGVQLDVPARGENEVLISGHGGSRISRSQFLRLFSCDRARVYGVGALPATFVISPRGLVVARFLGAISAEELRAAVARTLHRAGME